MTAESLARSLIVQARQRLGVLGAFLVEDAYNVAMRESQECVELALKGILRLCGIEPPHVHDVSGLMETHHERLAACFPGLDLSRLAGISKSLRRDRELSFYGDIDFIPSNSYTRAQAETAVAGATFCVESAESALNG